MSDIEQLKAAVREVIQEERKAFWVEPEQQQHFLDHEMLKVCRLHNEEMRRNHEFVSGFRRGLGSTQGIIWKSTLGVIVIGGLAWLGNAVWASIINAVAAIKGG